MRGIQWWAVLCSTATQSPPIGLRRVASRPLPAGEGMGARRAVVEAALRVVGVAGVAEGLPCGDLASEGLVHEGGGLRPDAGRKVARTLGQAPGVVAVGGEGRPVSIAEPEHVPWSSVTAVK